MSTLRVLRGDSHRFQGLQGLEPRLLLSGTQVLDGVDESSFFAASGTADSGLSLTASIDVTLTEFKFTYAQQADTLRLFHSSDLANALASVSVPAQSTPDLLVTETIITSGDGWQLDAGETYFLIADNDGVNLGNAPLNGSGVDFPDVDEHLTANTLVLEGSEVPASTVGAWLAFTDLKTVARTAKADFNGDGNADLTWERDFVDNQGRNRTEIQLWHMDGATKLSSAVVGITGRSFDIEAIGDLDGDGDPDLVFRRQDTGALTLWRMDGSVRESAHALPTESDLNKELVGMSDINGDGQMDLVWVDHSNNLLSYWQMADETTSSATVDILDNSGQVYDTIGRDVVGFYDADGDGHDDIFLRGLANGANKIALLDGTGQEKNETFTMQGLWSNQWYAGRVDDFNGDGIADFMWHKYTDATTRLWTLERTASGLIKDTALSLSDQAGLDWDLVDGHHA